MSSIHSTPRTILISQCWLEWSSYKTGGTEGGAGRDARRCVLGSESAGQHAMNEMNLHEGSGLGLGLGLG